MNELKEKCKYWGVKDINAKNINSEKNKLYCNSEITVYEITGLKNVSKLTITYRNNCNHSSTIKIIYNIPGINNTRIDKNEEIINWTTDEIENYIQGLYTQGLALKWESKDKNYRVYRKYNQKLFWFMIVSFGFCMIL